MSFANDIKMNALKTKDFRPYINVSFDLNLEEVQSSRANDGLDKVALSLGKELIIEIGKKRGHAL